MKHFFYGLLILLGVLGPLGELLGLGPLQSVARISGASPSPENFSRFRGGEPYALRSFVNLITPSKKTHWFTVTPALMTSLEGSSGRRIAYSRVLGWAPGYRGLKERMMLRRFLMFAICQGGPLYQGFGIDEPVVAFSLEIQAKAGDGDPWTLREICPQSS